MRYRFHFDEHRCAACGACVVACLDEHDADLAAGDPAWRAVRVIECAPRFRYRSESCLHCADAPCITACPLDCLRKNEQGLTVWDNAACVGCRRCLAVCPVAAPRFGPDRKMQKCDGCAARVAAGLAPACVRVCPTGALTGEREE